MKNLRSSYIEYKKSCPKPVKLKDYLTLTSDYNKFLIEKVLEGKEVTLPSRMGTLAVVGKTQNFKNGGVSLAPDWVKTKVLWEKSEKAKVEKKLVYHTNSHTDGVRYKFLWSKKNVLVENKTLFSLRMTRTNKRAVHQKILEGSQYFTKS